MNKIEKKGFIKIGNDFSQCSAAQLMRHFHQYGFKDAQGRDLVACEDFCELIEQFSHAERIPLKDAAAHILAKFDAKELMDNAIVVNTEGN